jgi:hypothetical protein
VKTSSKYCIVVQYLAPLWYTTSAQKAKDSISINLDPVGLESVVFKMHLSAVLSIGTSKPENGGSKAEATNN